MKNINSDNNFDVIRLVLAVLVYFAHWNTLTSQDISNPIFHLSGYAVDMFFVVSGFLIFWSFDADQNKKNFYIKRFFRIYPLYAFLIILQTLFFILFSDGSSFELVKYFFANMFFLNFIAPSVGSAFSALEVNAINGSLWTLKNEVCFYLVLPFLFFLYKKLGSFFLVILYITSVLYMFVVDYLDFEKLIVQFPAQLRLFIVGILLYISFRKIENKNIQILSVFSVILIAFLYDNEYFMFALYPLCIGIIMIHLAYFARKVKINFDFSYSLYIIHFPVIQIALYLGINPTNPIVSFLSLFVVILVLSYFSEVYIEKKFIKIGKEIIKRDKM